MPKSALASAHVLAPEKCQTSADLGSATVDAVTIVNPAVRFTPSAWIGHDAVAFILRFLAGARCFVFK